MEVVCSFLTRRWRTICAVPDRGASLTEYAFVAALVTVVCIAGLTMIRQGAITMTDALVSDIGSEPGTSTTVTTTPSTTTTAPSTTTTSPSPTTTRCRTRRC